ncbi:MAG: hypothetical protein IKC63_01665 [Clostridia bacterium]|nr:hypothetical protein [Clostridia bacterium]
MKLVYFNAALTAALLLARFLFGVEDLAGWLLVFYYVIANLSFWLFDILIKRLTLTYMLRFRHRLKRFFK